MRTLSLAFLLLFSPLSVAAESFSLPIYAAGFLDRQSISLSGQKLQPVVASAVIGTWLYEGIALEAELGVGLSDDNAGTLAVDSESQLAVGIRFESAPINNLAAYALFSASSASIASKFTVGTADRESHGFSGFRGVFGLTFSVLPRWVVDAAFVTANYDDDFSVNSFRIGARYAFSDVRPRKRRGWFQ